MTQRLTAALGIRRPAPVYLLAWLCALLLVAGTLPLYAISQYNHPYYEDYRFSSAVHDTWLKTHDPAKVLSAAVTSAQKVREGWQGTYTGTFLSNLQPGVFSESLYWLTTFILLTAYLLCFGFLLHTVFRKLLNASRAETVIITSLFLFVSIQFLPSVNEAFYWFNGGIGNIFIYSLLSLTLALALRLATAHGGAPWLTAALFALLTLLGGGSYGGGLFGLLIFAAITLFAFLRGHRYRFIYAALTAWFLACFIYNTTAPGNAVRASILISASLSAPEAIFKSCYYGVALIGGYLTLPVVAVALALAPLLYRLAAASKLQYRHPLLVLVGGVALFCAQLTPPLYAGVFLGGERIINTYFVSFVMMLLLYETYLLGALARRRERLGLRPVTLTSSAQRGLILACACLFFVGCLGYKQADATLYGPMNMAGGSAALSIVTGEAARYDRQMQAREALLADTAQSVVTLAPLTAVPRVFMEDLLQIGAQYDVRPTLQGYYHKTEILIEGGVSP